MSAPKNELTEVAAVRPKRLPETPPPPIPDVDISKPDVASVEYSQHRTKAHVSDPRSV